MRAGGAAATGGSGGGGRGCQTPSPAALLRCRCHLHCVLAHLLEPSCAAGAHTRACVTLALKQSLHSADPCQCGPSRCRRTTAPCNLARRQQQQSPPTQHPAHVKPRRLDQRQLGLTHLHGRCRPRLCTHPAQRSAAQHVGGGRAGPVRRRRAAAQRIRECARPGGRDAPRVSAGCPGGPCAPLLTAPSPAPGATRRPHSPAPALPCLSWGARGAAGAGGGRQGRGMRRRRRASAGIPPGRIRSRDRSIRHPPGLLCTLADPPFRCRPSLLQAHASR